MNADLLSLYLKLGDRKNALAVARRKFTTAHNPAKFSGPVLLFFYYSGIAFSWDNDFEGAEKCFELVCFSPPLAIPSFITLCAYRKLVLVSLIVHGYVPAFTLERMRSFFDIRGMYEHTNIATYEELASEYCSLKIKAFQKLRFQKQSVLTRDGNLGLAKIAEAQMMRHLVTKMRSLYTVCSLEQIFQYAGVSEPTSMDYVKLCHVIDALHTSGMGVSFRDSERKIVEFSGEWAPTTFNTRESVKALEDHVRVVISKSKTLEEKRESTLAHRDAQPSASADAMTMVDDVFDAESFSKHHGLRAEYLLHGDDDDDDDNDNDIM